MSLAGEHEMNRAGRVIEEMAEPVRVPEQQCRPLVRCETTGEADDQGVGVEGPAGASRDQFAETRRGSVADGGESVVFDI